MKKLKPRVTGNEFCNGKFKTQLTTKLSLKNLNNNSIGSNKFMEICVNTLDIFALRKEKFLLGNNIPFMNKNLVNAHSKRTHLRNKFLENRTETYRVCYNKQHNFCAILLRKTKKYYSGNVNEKRCERFKKMFWKTTKPLMSDKVKSPEKINLVYENKVTKSDGWNAKILNSFFFWHSKTL